MEKQRKSLQEINRDLTILGNYGSGKSCFIQKLRTGLYEKNTCITNSVLAYKIRIPYDDYTVSFTIWDTPGAEMFESIVRMYYRRSNAILIVYDISRKNSVEFLKKILSQIKLDCQNSPTIILVGNKIDLKSEIDYDDIIELGNRFGCIHTLISVKTSQNFKELIDLIAIMSIRGSIR